ncbi:MAG: GNAT family N-acetyltransferase [Actinocatenispora sp.]
MPGTDLTVRPYRDADEQEWLRCRVLGFLDTTYFDDVRAAKPRHDDTVAELVAVRDAQVVGLLDATLTGDAATIETIAVHPDHRRAGVGSALLRHLLPLLRNRKASTLDAWTREDAAALGWYRRRGFTETFRYLHVYADGEDECRALLGDVDGALVRHAFAHVLDLDREAELRSRFRRVYVCRRFERPVR